MGFVDVMLKLWTGCEGLGTKGAAESLNRSSKERVDGDPFERDGMLRRMHAGRMHDVEQRAACRAVKEQMTKWHVRCHGKYDNLCHFSVWCW